MPTFGRCPHCRLQVVRELAAATQRKVLLAPTEGWPDHTTVYIVPETYIGVPEHDSPDARLYIIMILPSNLETCTCLHA